MVMSGQSYRIHCTAPTKCRILIHCILLFFSGGHSLSSKEERLSNGRENLYENISSLGANSTTKTACDGSSLASQPTADSKGTAFDTLVGKRPLPSELEPFCQAYMIKPKPPVDGTDGGRDTTQSTNCESLMGEILPSDEKSGRKF